MREIFTTTRFRKKLSTFLERHSELAASVQATMQLIGNNPRAAQLHTHSLNGVLSDLFAARVSRDHRIVFALEPGRVIFLDIGTHDDVYR